MDTTFLLNSLWVMVSAVLVILMIGGFILLETGSTRMKNAGHIAGKTILTFGISSIVFWAVGYGLIFGEGNALIGLSDFFYSGYDVEGLGLSGAVFFLFQTAFAGISITIAFGGFAERAKMSVYLVFSVLFAALVYPPIAHWIWGGGWLAEHGKQDFAGSTVVHLTGAMAALAGLENTIKTVQPITSMDITRCTLPLASCFYGLDGSASMQEAPSLLMKDSLDLSR
jgi:Amt family ammonium transporter